MFLFIFLGNVSSMGNFFMLKKGSSSALISILYMVFFALNSRILDSVVFFITAYVFAKVSSYNFAAFSAFAVIFSNSSLSLSNFIASSSPRICAVILVISFAEKLASLKGLKILLSLRKSCNTILVGTLLSLKSLIAESNDAFRAFMFASNILYIASIISLIGFSVLSLSGRGLM